MFQFGLFEQNSMLQFTLNVDEFKFRDEYFYNQFYNILITDLLLSDCLTIEFLYYCGKVTWQIIFDSKKSNSIHNF